MVRIILLMAVLFQFVGMAYYVKTIYNPRVMSLERQKDLAIHFLGQAFVLLLLIVVLIISLFGGWGV